MSLREKELLEHCQFILANRQIRNKFVILCEGEIKKTASRLSPQSYRAMEDFPDANFYKACVPRDWRQKIPTFFNCGDRNDVLNTYFNLLRLHEENPEASYLNPQQLFAIVDLDLQNKRLDDSYPFKDLEQIFEDLYEKSLIKVNRVRQHRIWVTGLIHKESYFIFPDTHIQSILSEHSAVYQNSAARLENIYLDMADKIKDDADLKDNFSRVKGRISHCQNLELSEVDKLQLSWQKQYQVSHDNSQSELVLALLTIKKAKQYWLEVEPPEDYTSPPERYREQLALQIGRFYAHNSDNPSCHISHLLKLLKLELNPREQE